jgi:CheY-like chemotaxis protein
VGNWMLSTLGLIGTGVALGLWLAWWRRRAKHPTDSEKLSGQGLLRLDAQACVSELGAVAREMLGFERRCDRGHLQDLPLVGLDSWLCELEADRAVGKPIPVAERELLLESFHWTEDRLLRSTQSLHCRLLPRNPQRSLLPAWMSFSVVTQEREEGGWDCEDLFSLLDITAETTMSQREKKRGLLEGMTVLLAEDFKSNQVLLRFFLEKEGAEIIQAGNGQHALDQALSGKFDLVFLDADLPDVDGVQASRTLRQEGFQGPIVVLTPHLDPTSIECYRRAGCTGHLEKPFKSRELREMAEHIAEENAVRSAEQNAECQQDADKPGCIFDDQAFMELINEFVASLEERLHELETALARQDWSKIESESHRLAGTAGMYRLPELSRLGAEIEDLVRAQPGSKSLHRKIGELKTSIHGISGNQLIQEPRE